MHLCSIHQHSKTPHEWHVCHRNILHVTAHTEYPNQPLKVESDIVPGWNLLVVSKASFDAAGIMQPAVTVAQSHFVAVSNSAAAHHHHGDLLSTFDFSPSSSYFAPKFALQQSCLSETFPLDSYINQPEATPNIPGHARAVFEMIAQLRNRTIVSFGDSNERNMIRDLHSICKHLSGLLACVRMPLLAEAGRAVHVEWPAINFTWITISVPGVITLPNPMFSLSIFKHVRCSHHISTSSLFLTRLPLDCCRYHVGPSPRSILKVKI